MARMRARRTDATCGACGGDDDSPPAKGPRGGVAESGGALGAGAPRPKPRSTSAWTTGIDSSEPPYDVAPPAGTRRRGQGPGAAEPWAPQWSPQSPPHHSKQLLSSSLRLEADAETCGIVDLEALPAKPVMPRPPAAPRPSTMGGTASRRPDEAYQRGTTAGTGDSRRGEWRNAQGGEAAMSSTARATDEKPRGRRPAAGGEDDAALPAGARAADFGTLQTMIAKGIQEAEVGASKFGASILEVDDDLEWRHIRQERRRRHEEELASRQREKEVARERRRREEEQRRRRETEATEREEEEARRKKEREKLLREQCERELRAAARIQARVRGRRSRGGHHLASPVIAATLHSEPFIHPASLLLVR